MHELTILLPRRAKHPWEGIVMKMKTSKEPSKARPEIAVPAVRPKLQEILAATDFSDHSLPAVRYALALSAKSGASLALLHVVELASSLSGMESVVLARTNTEISSLVHTRLEALAQRETRNAEKVTTVVRTGKPFHEIALAASESAADLIVIATHGYTGAQRVLLGSTAECVVRHAPCPVLTVRPPITLARNRKTPRFRLRRILVPIDFSKLSQAAVPWATSLAAQFDAEIVLLHVVEKFPIDYLLGGELLNHTMVPLMKQSEADLEGMATGLSKSTGRNLSAVVREGKPFEEICRAAETLSVDLIVLTTHGYTGLKHVWLGSTAERVVRHAPCPVLVVRELKV